MKLFLCEGERKGRRIRLPPTRHVLSVELMSFSSKASKHTGVTTWVCVCVWGDDRMCVCVCVCATYAWTVTRLWLRMKSALLHSLMSQWSVCEWVCVCVCVCVCLCVLVHSRSKRVRQSGEGTAMINMGHLHNLQKEAMNKQAKESTAGIHVKRLLVVLNYQTRLLFSFQPV